MNRLQRIEAERQQIFQRTKTFLTVGGIFCFAAIILSVVGYRLYIPWLVEEGFSVDTRKLAIAAWVASVIMLMCILILPKLDGFWVWLRIVPILGLFAAWRVAVSQDYPFQWAARWFVEGLGGDYRPGITYLFCALILAGPGLGLIATAGINRLMWWGTLLQLQLKSKDSNTRTRVAEVLGVLKNPRSVESLTTVLKKDERDSVREAAAWALWRIGGRYAVKPLLEVFNKDKNTYVRLACYSTLERIPEINIPDKDIQELVDSLATEIRFLYSRTRTVIDYLEMPSSPPYEIGEHEEPDPDIDRIDDLITLLPNSLRNQVSTLSGEATRYFRHD
jgi:hypothetical protein